MSLPLRRRVLPSVDRDSVTRWMFFLQVLFEWVLLVFLKFPSLKSLTNLENPLETLFRELVLPFQYPPVTLKSFPKVACNPEETGKFVLLFLPELVAKYLYRCAYTILVTYCHYLSNNHILESISNNVMSNNMILYI